MCLHRAGQSQTALQRGCLGWGQPLPVPSLPSQQTLRADDFTSALLAGFLGNDVFREDEKQAAANRSREGANGMLAKPRPGLCVIVISTNAPLDNLSIDRLQSGCPSSPQSCWPVGDCM